MSTHLHGFICSAPVYEYNGWTFELNYNCGPWPLRKDGMPWERRPSSAFWDAMREWEDLPDNEKQKTRVGGGCVRF